MIYFRKLRWKNFLATGSDFTEIQLDRSPSTLISGTNGSGKTTMIDALIFALYGTPYRNINKPQLVNSVNKKNCIVEVEFSIGSKNYMVRRGIKPNVFEIFVDGELLNQDAAARDYQKYLEENILKMNKKSCTQVVILGATSYTPFMQLPAAHRREVIENLLDINIFSLMNQTLKDKLGETKDLLKNVETDITILKNKIDMQKKYVDNLESDNNKKKDALNASIQKATSEIHEFNKSIDKFVEEASAIQSSLEGRQDAETERTDLADSSRNLASRARQLDKEIAFYSENDNCPSCQQCIDETHKENTLTELKTELDNLKSEAKVVAHKIETNKFVVENYQKLYNDKLTTDREIFTATTKRDSLVGLIKTWEDEINSLDTSVDIDEQKAILKSLAKDGSALIKTKTELNEQKTYYDICATMLKDGGIKTKVIRQYLPAMNKLINKYLGVFDFFVSFELDESFEETIKSRYRDEFSYSSFSEGEKQRIDMALLLTWRTIAKMKNSANTNLLICDEVLDGHLDQTAVDNLLRIFGDMKETNLFVVSHVPDSYFDKFRSSIQFEKVGNYSVMKGS